MTAPCSWRIGTVDLMIWTCSGVKDIFTNSSSVIVGLNISPVFLRAYGLIPCRIMMDGREFINTPVAAAEKRIVRVSWQWHGSCQPCK